MLSPDQLFPFALDTFQLQAIDALNTDKSVVVCAPTGSGKTLVGEYAIYRALHHQKRVFYTTPLKALSNQKLRDFRAQFGDDKVGLLTGDTSTNRDAPIVVMTTEIFRNMLYGTAIGETGTTLADVQAVVLDECHYMNDRQRGTVWEESIIYCPPGIQLVGLSATVANGDQLTDWIDQIHNRAELVYSDYRPVPLNFHFCTSKGIFPLLNDNKAGMHPRLKRQRKPPRQQRGQKKKSQVASISTVVSRLQQEDMLPAIYFIFSRKGCDKSVQEVDHLSLVTPAEAQALKQRIDRFLALNPGAGRTGQVQPLYRGIAAHHAGILPAWKGLVEELFQAGLIKVVFATETLAAGINMPARTTVIASLSKRTDSGHRLLHASEFLQMAGRAGRRGMDDEGHVVTVENPFEGAREASALAVSKPDPLVSQFTPSYGMVLNLLQGHSEAEAQALVERSFGQYLSTLHLTPQMQAIKDLESTIEAVKAQLASIDLAVIDDFVKQKERLREEKRLLKILQQQAEESLSGDLRMAASFAVAGTTLALLGQNLPKPDPIPALLVSKLSGPGQFPYLVCLTQQNRWYVVSVKEVFAIHSEYDRRAVVDEMTVPKGLGTKPGSTLPGDDATAEIAAQLPDLPKMAELAPELRDQQARIDQVEERIRIHPAHALGKPKTFIKKQQRLQRLQDELADRQGKFQHLSHRYWEEFTDLMAILTHFGCLEENRPTNFGQMCAAIRGENELWLGMALASGEFDHLAPHELAAACAAIVTDMSRPDTWTRYRTSANVEEALEGLRQIRRDIFQQQRRHAREQQDTLPIYLEWDMIALVEQWALETEWEDVCNNTSLDEGDVVRILRRTLDLLSQIPHVPFLTDAFKNTARQAAYLIDRFPVNESQ
ncbi:MAG: DEAD/DEAH box helicase [Cyanobacteria bacterium P01_A01_bin.105]